MSSASAGSRVHRATPAAPPSRAKWLSLHAVVAACGIILVAILGLRLLPIGAQNLRIAGLFSTDEQLAGELVQSMIHHGNFGLSHFYSYGPLDLYLARALVWPLGHLNSVNEEAILIALRLVSLTAGLGTLLETYVLGRRLWDTWVGGFGSVLLAASATMLAWSTTAHPDMLQLFLVLASLLLATSLPKKPGRVGLAAACVCAALAFATKYVGLLLLPPIWLSIILGRILNQSPGIHRSGLREVETIVLDILLSVIVFSAIFVLVDPSSLVEPRAFVSQVTLESRLAHQGHLFLLGIQPLAWFERIAGSDVLGPATVTAGIVGLTCFLAGDVRATILGINKANSRGAAPCAIAPRCEAFNTKRDRGTAQDVPDQATATQAACRLPLETWTVGYLVVLVVWFGDLQPRYALPVLPGLVLCGAAAGCWLADRLPARRLVLAIILGIMLTPPLKALADYESAQVGRMESPAIDARLAAGQWLTGNVTETAPILHDAYAYVPPEFDDLEESFALTHAQIAAFRPQLIIADAAIRDRFRDSTEAGRYQGGAAAFYEAATTYQELESGTFPCYPFLQRFGPTSIYGSLSPRVAGDGC